MSRSATDRPVEAVALAVAVIASLATPARAWAWGPRLADPRDAPADSLQLGVEAGFEAVGSEDLLSTLVQASYRRRDTVRLGVGVPLRVDLDRGDLRARDHDSPSDWGRLLRHLELGGPSAPVSVAAGDLGAVSLGHGTIINHYGTATDPDRHHSAMRLQGRAGRLSAEGVVGDLIRPRVLAARGAWGAGATRPPRGVLERLSFGVSLAADLDAPVELRRSCPRAAAEPACSQADLRLRLDGRGEPEVRRDRPVAVVGLDVAFGVLHGPVARLVAYADANQIAEHGGGLHVGLMGDARLSASGVASLRLEYRRAQAGYLPAFFDLRYDLHRWDLAGQPKAGWLGALDEPGDGFYGELGFGWGQHARLVLVYEGQEHEPTAGRLTARAELPRLGPLRAAALYQRDGVRSLGDLPGWGGALVVAEGRLQVTPLVYVALHHARQWVLPEAPSAHTPWQPIAVWGLSVGGALELQAAGGGR